MHRIDLLGKAFDLRTWKTEIFASRNFCGIYFCNFDPKLRKQIQ